MSYSTIVVELMFILLGLTMLSLLIRYKTSSYGIMAIGIGVLSFVAFLVSVCIEPTDFDMVNESGRHTHNSMSKEVVEANFSEVDVRFQMMLNVQYAQWAFYALFTILSGFLTIYRFSTSIKVFYNYPIWIDIVVGTVTLMVWCSTGVSGLVYSLARQESILGSLFGDSKAQLYCVIVWCIYATLLEAFLNSLFIYNILAQTSKLNKQLMKGQHQYDPNSEFDARQRLVQRLQRLMVVVWLCVLVSVALWSALPLLYSLKVKQFLYTAAITTAIAVYILPAVFLHVSDNLLPPTKDLAHSNEFPGSMGKNIAAKSALLPQSIPLATAPSLGQHQQSSLDNQPPPLPPRENTQSTKALSIILGTYYDNEYQPSEFTVPFKYQDMYSDIESNKPSIFNDANGSTSLKFF